MNFPGNNTIRLNQASLMQAVQREINEGLYNKPAVRVTAVKFSSDGLTADFTITTDTTKETT
jgi:ribosome-binding factor A